MAKDVKKRKIMGKEAYKFAKEKFDIKIIAEKIENVYTNLVKR